MNLMPNQLYHHQQQQQQQQYTTMSQGNNSSTSPLSTNSYLSSSSSTSSYSPLSTQTVSGSSSSATQNVNQSQPQQQQQQLQTQQQPQQQQQQPQSQQQQQMQQQIVNSTGTALYMTANGSPLLLSIPNGGGVQTNGTSGQQVLYEPSMYTMNTSKPEAKKVKIQKSQPSKVVHIRNIPPQITEVEVIQFGLIFGSISNVLNLRSKCQVGSVARNMKNIKRF